MFFHDMKARTTAITLHSSSRLLYYCRELSMRAYSVIVNIKITESDDDEKWGKETEEEKRYPPSMVSK